MTDIRLDGKVALVTGAASDIGIGRAITLALVRAGHLSINDVIRWLTIEPAKLLRMPLGTLTPGADADVCIFDPQAAWIVGRDALASQGKNTPFLGHELVGRVRTTLREGRVVYEA